MNSSQRLSIYDKLFSDKDKYFKVRTQKPTSKEEEQLRDYCTFKP